MALPTVITEIAFESNPDDAVADQVWTDVTGYVDMKAGIRISRGRSDEFSAVQPGRLAITLNNSDGRFTPGRSSSPYYPNVTTGKRIRVGFGFTGNGKQLYPDDPSFEGTALFGWVRSASPTPTVTQSSAQAQHGTKSMLITWTGAGDAYATKDISGLLVGQQYIASLYVYVPTGSPSPSFTVDGFVGMFTTTKNSWVLLSVVFVATASVHTLRVSAPATGGGQLCYVDSAQVEAGSSRTTFEPTGATFSWRFTGDVDEFPIEWAGTPSLFATSAVTASDRLKKLNDLGEFRTLIEEDVLDDEPFAFYPLTEPVASLSAGDVSGNGQPSLQVVQIGTGGSFQLGQTNNSAPTYYLGRTTSATFSPASATDGKYLRAYLNEPIASGEGATVSAWVGEGSSPPATGPVAIMTAGNGSWFGVNKRTNGNITAAYYSAPTDSLYEVASGFGLSTSIELVTARLEVASYPAELTFYFNGSLLGSPVYVYETVPQWTQVSVGGRAKQLFKGNIAYAQFYDHAVASGSILAQYNVGSTGKTSTNESTGQRMQKLVEFRGMRYVQGGQGTAQPIGPQEIQGSPMDAIRAVETTEDGVFYIAGEGTASFLLRSYRFNVSPTLTLTADQIDPDAVSFRGDDFGLVNDVTATRRDGAMVRVVNQASVDDHGRRKATVEALSTTDAALRSLAGRQAVGFGTQRNRATGVRISLLNDPDLCLPAMRTGIGGKVSVTGLPAQAPSSSVDLFVEGWTEFIGREEWTMDFNTSPADPWNVWQLNVAGHSELGVSSYLAY